MGKTGLEVSELSLGGPFESKESKQIALVHPKAHFRRVFEITGMAGDFEVASP